MKRSDRIWLANKLEMDLEEKVDQCYEVELQIKYLEEKKERLDREIDIINNCFREMEAEL